MRRKLIELSQHKNYFYSAIHSIEGIFAREADEHSFNHENRYRKFVENQRFFSKEIFELFRKVDKDERNKVAYRGENGEMYEDIKKLAKLLVDKL